MAVDISQETQAIRTAVFAKDVRDSIANGIDAVATEMNTYENNLSSDNDQFKADITTEEAQHAQAESARVTAETARVSAENTRQANEQTRQTNETARETAFAGMQHVDANLELSAARQGYDSLLLNLQNKDSQLAEKAKQADLSTTNSKAQIISSNLGCSQPINSNYAGANKKFFELRNISEFDDSLNSKCSLGTLSVVTAGTDGRVVYNLKNSPATNITLQAKLYWDGTQLSAKIGYSSGEKGKLPNSVNGDKDITIAFASEGVIYNNGTANETLITPANLTNGWYLVTFAIFKSTGYCTISVENDNIQPKTFIRSNIPMGVDIVNALCEVYGTNDYITDFKVIYNNDTVNAHLLPPFILNTNNFHTPLELNLQGVSVIINFPANYNPYIKNKCVVWFHGSGGVAKGLWLPENAENVLIKPLLDAGYVVIGSDYTNANCWGNAQSVADIDALLKYWQNYSNIQNDYYILAGSMGGIVSLNAISHNVIKPKAYAGIFPVSNLYWEYKNAPWGIPDFIKTAYGITSDSDFESKTSSYDPVNDTDPKVFKDFPFLIWSSYGDTVVDRANNADKFSTQVNGVGGNVSIITTTGDHGDASNYSPTDIVNFFNKY
jgi:hypothetical protein